MSDPKKVVELVETMKAHKLEIIKTLKSVNQSHVLVQVYEVEVSLLDIIIKATKDEQYLKYLFQSYLVKQD